MNLLQAIDLAMRDGGTVRSLTGFHTADMGAYSPGEFAPRYLVSILGKIGDSVIMSDEWEWISPPPLDLETITINRAQFDELHFMFSVADSLDRYWSEALRKFGDQKIDLKKFNQDLRDKGPVTLTYDQFYDVLNGKISPNNRDEGVAVDIAAAWKLAHEVANAPA